MICSSTKLRPFAPDLCINTTCSGVSHDSVTNRTVNTITDSLLSASDNNMRSTKQTIENTVYILYVHAVRAKGDWDFRISDLVKNPDGTDIQPLW